MADPMDVMLDYDYDDDAYKELEKQAGVDSRVGNHTAIVTKVSDDTWDDGSPRRKILFALATAGNAKADLTISKLPSPEEVKAKMATYTDKQKQGITLSRNIYKQFAQHYGVNPFKVQEGDEFRVKTYKTRRDKDGSGGFIRINALLPKTEESNGASSGGGPGF